jgi:hypothetical protein
MAEYLTQRQANLCATLGTHCHPWQSYLIISIMAADVHLHTDEQTQTPVHNKILQIWT